MNEIRPDKKYYVPVMNGERQFYLASESSLGAQLNAINTERKLWEELGKQGWTIEEFWGSEYE